MTSPTGNPPTRASYCPAFPSRGRSAMLAVALAFVASGQALAQSVSIKMNESAPDSSAWIVRRLQHDVAEAMVRSRDKSVALLLTDTALVLQLTQRGLDRVEQGVSDAPTGAMGRLVGRMLSAGVTELLDHGVAYRLSALRGARAEGGRLVLEDREGHRVFENVEVNGTRLLEDLAPRDAERFAMEVNRAIRRLR